MDVKLQRVGVVFLVALFTFAILSGVQLGWKRYVLENPVVAKVSAISGVNSATMKSGESNSTVEVNLQGVSDLKETVHQLLEAAGNNKLIIKDKRDPQLQAVLEKVRFNVEEALAQGDFTTMQTAIEGAAKAAQLDRFGVYIDSDYIYLQLHKGNNYLYQIFPRQQAKSQLITRG